MLGSTEAAKRCHIFLALGPCLQYLRLHSPPVHGAAMFRHSDAEVLNVSERLPRVVPSLGSADNVLNFLDQLRHRRPQLLNLATDYKPLKTFLARLT
jgi:hypothetical protein